MKFSELKVGDEVAYDPRFGHPVVIKIVKVTATQVVTEGGQRWRRSNGWRVGDFGGRGLYRVYARPARDVDRIAHRIREAGQRLAAIVVTAENVDQVEGLLPDLERKPARAGRDPDTGLKPDAEACKGFGGAAAGPACCGRAGEYNGYGSDGPRLFACPKGCSCHD